MLGDIVIGTEGSGGGGNILFGVNLNGQHELKFEIKRAAPYVPTPVAKDELLFLWADNGIVSCVDAKTGESYWSERIGGNVSSSPVIAGDKLLGIAENGTLTVLSASRNFQQLGKVELEEITRSTPLLAEDYLLVRTDSHLICVGKPNKPASLYMPLDGATPIRVQFASVRDGIANAARVDDQDAPL